MLRYVLDTNHLTLYEHRHPRFMQRLLAVPPDSVGVSAVVVYEALRGRLAFVAKARSGTDRVMGYERLLLTVERLGDLPLVPFDQRSEDEFQRLLKFRLRVGKQDLLIGANTIAQNLM